MGIYNGNNGGAKIVTGAVKPWFALSLLVSFFICLAAGCSKPKEEKEAAFMIKTPTISITRLEFAEELDLKRAAYPYNIDENPDAYNEMVIHLVKMLSEEIVLLSAAAEKQISLTDEEVALAEAEFKKDYPENSFDQMLLTNAISYAFWKKRFKKNMIMEKLVDQELRAEIEILPQDLMHFYKNLPPEIDYTEDGKPFEKDKSRREKELVSRLKMQKTQELYDEWIQGLWDTHPVEINKAELKTFLIALDDTEGNQNETKK